MKIYDKIYSKIDNAIKYVFLSDDGLAIEATYINKNDGKYIICLPTQTSCKIGCRFCHITDIASQIKLRNIESSEIVEMTNLIYDNLDLQSESKPLLISFMGCGEPILNNKNLVDAIIELSSNYKLIRFALATSIPKFATDNFNQLILDVKENNINLKIHLSLHYTNDAIRNDWMPNGLNILDSIELLNKYKKETGNIIEIHYTLIDGVNNKEEDVDRLIEMFKNSDVLIKFLFFNEKELLDFHVSPFDKNSNIMSKLNSNGIRTEYYLPPALDIGGSCGQLLKEYYLKFNRCD